ncbi:MAG: MaoC family dehydratase [Aquisalimonadaceae bacterium]
MNHGYFYEDLTIGQTASFSKTVTEADIVNFAGVSGDFNPMHVDEDFAGKTRFKGRIAHGMLSAAYISRIVGMYLPGPGSIYVSQSLRFRAPVKIGDTMTVRAEVREMSAERGFVTLDIQCLVREKAVVTGDAVMMVPFRA